LSAASNPERANTDLRRHQPHETPGKPFLQRPAIERLLLREKEREGKLSPRSVGYIREVLRVALNRAIKWNLVTKNAAALTDPPRRERKELVILTPEQTEAFLRAAAGDRLEAFHLIIATLGLRRGEGLALRWQDINLDTGELRVRQTLQRVGGKLIFKEPKTDKSRRTLSLPGVVVDTLRQHHDRQGFEAQSPAWQDHGLVFPNIHGAPCDPANVLTRFKQALAAANLPDQRLHDLRHFAATFPVAKCPPMRVVMDILGYSKMAAPSDLYTHVMLPVHREVADLIDQVLRPKMQETVIP
jgi:integrase